MHHPWSNCKACLCLNWKEANHKHFHTVWKNNSPRSPGTNKSRRLGGGAVRRWLNVKFRRWLTKLGMQACLETIGCGFLTSFTIQTLPSKPSTGFNKDQIKHSATCPTEVSDAYGHHMLNNIDTSSMIERLCLIWKEAHHKLSQTVWRRDNSPQARVLKQCRLGGGAVRRWFNVNFGH